MRKNAIRVSLGAVAALLILPAQQPPCNHCSATYIGNDKSKRI